MIFLRLFYVFSYIGLFNFGGGYAMLSFIQQEGVQKNEAVISALIRMGGGEYLKEAHKKALREFAPVLFPDLDPESEEFLFFIELRAGIFLSGLTAWVESGRGVSFDTMVRYIRQQIEIFTQD